MVKKRILVVGGCGFIGLNLVENLLNETDYQIVVLDNLYTGRKSFLDQISASFENRVNFIEGDITNQEDVDNAVKGCSQVINLAAQVGVMESIKNPVLDANINILGTINLLNSCVSNNVKKFISASSAAPLGKQSPPVNEKSLPLPLSPYGASKLASEAYCSAFSECYQIDTTILRFSNVFGPKSIGKTSVLSVFLKKIIDGKDIVIYGDGTQTRDFIHVKDICQAIVLSLEKKSNESYCLFQIGTGIETSVNNFFDYISHVMEDNGFSVSDPKYVDWRDGEIRRSFTDISHAKSVLDFNPKINLEAGVKETALWFIENYQK